MELIRQTASLRVLAVLSRSESFSAAAATMGISQSAVSQHITALEKHVGLVLVQRDTRPVDLTRAGYVLAEHGAVVAARLEQAGRDVDEIAGRHHQRLRFGGFPTALATFVPKALTLLRRQLPDVRLEVVDDHVQGLTPRLLRGELDVAVLFDDPERSVLSRHADTLVLTPLLDDPYTLLVPRSHRLSRSASDPRLADLRDEIWVGGSPGSTWFDIVRKACATAGFEPRVGLTSDDHLSVQAFVAAGLGVAVVPGLVAARRIAGVQARTLRTGLPVRSILAARPATPFAPQAATTMVALLEQVTRTWSRPSSPHVR